MSSMSFSIIRSYSWTRRIVNLYQYEDDFGNKVFRITRLGQEPLSVRYIEKYDRIYFVLLDVFSIVTESGQDQVWQEIPSEYKTTLAEYMMLHDFLVAENQTMTLDIITLDGVIKLFFSIPSLDFSEASKLQDVFVYFYRINFRVSGHSSLSGGSGSNDIGLINNGAIARSQCFHCCCPGHGTVSNVMAFAIGFICAFFIFYFVRF
jgi:hypothetical protein